MSIEKIYGKKLEKRISKGRKNEAKKKKKSIGINKSWEKEVSNLRVSPMFT